MRKLFSDESEGKKLNVPSARVKVSVLKPTVPTSSKQHKKTVRIVLFISVNMSVLDGHSMFV